MRKKVHNNLIQDTYGDTHKKIFSYYTTISRIQDIKMIAAASDTTPTAVINKAVDLYIAAWQNQHDEEMITAAQKKWNGEEKYINEHIAE